MLRYGTGYDNLLLGADVRLVSDGICAADCLPSISSINRIIRDKSLYDVNTTADDVNHDEVIACHTGLTENGIRKMENQK